MSSSNDDKFFNIIIANGKVEELYREFIDRYLNLAIFRQEPFIVQGFAGQYHAFIPLNNEGLTMIVVADTFFKSEADFKRFYVSNHSRALGVTSITEEDWLKHIRVYSSEEIMRLLTNIRTVLQGLVTTECQNNRLNKYCQQTKTVISIMSDLNSDYSLRNIYQIVVDAVIFLFEIDTAAIMLKKDGKYVTEVVEGRNKQLIQNMGIESDNRFIGTVEPIETSVFTLNSHELLHAGFPEEISMATMFPFTSETGSSGLLLAFNSFVDDESCESITNFCKLVAYLCSLRRQKEELEETTGRLNVLSVQSSSLHSLYRQRQLLYEGIVNEASSIADAKKCSLMMLDNNGMLEVRAASGISKSLMENVKVRQGEGISGRVYQQGEHVLIKNDTDLKKYRITPRSHYKTSSSLSLPLKVANDILGVLNLSDKRLGTSFNLNDIAVLSPFILQASALLKLGVCYDELESMKKLSMTDSLTGLFNRRYFDIRLDEEFLRARRYNLILSFAIMDIDDFKLFNDTEGHLAGDSILKEVSYIMTSAIRSHDILARFGGEEFAIIMPQTSKLEAFRVSERIRENVKRNVKTAWKKYFKKELTISGGVATFPECGKSKEEIILCADKALYKAKKLGKDKTLYWV
ncbi:MAG TPA: sensor domain-containing diguanylate cyclase [Dissulfurispiraceae bacterium]|nr:sensor domain-containing diguanylate cyclase [Dissulfurispiraceae bacterium]